MLSKLLYDLYRQSGLAFHYKKYLTLIALLPPAVGIGGGTIAFLIHSPAAGIAVGISMALLTFAALLAYPLHLIAARKSHFDNYFIYTLSTMLPLLAAGVPLGRILTRLAEVESDKYIAREMALITREIKAMGASPHEALSNSAERVKSVSYREVVSLLNKTSTITERLDVVLQSRLEWMLKAKQMKAQSLVRSTALIFEVYIVIAILMPILVSVIALALIPMGAVEIAGQFMDPQALLTLAGLIYAPIISIAFYILFDSMLNL